MYMPLDDNTWYSCCSILRVLKNGSCFLFYASVKAIKSCTLLYGNRKLKHSRTISDGRIHYEN